MGCGMTSGVIRISMEAKKCAEKLAYQLSFEGGQRVTTSELVSRILIKECDSLIHSGKLGRSNRR